MKSKLEQALNDLEPKAEILKSRRPPETKHEKALRQATFMLNKSNQENDAAIKACADMLSITGKRSLKARMILSAISFGHRFEIIVPQYYMEAYRLSSGFTSIEEVIPMLYSDDVEVDSLRQLSLGEFRYSVSENGMMNLIESKPDSSD